MTVGLKPGFFVFLFCLLLVSVYTEIAVSSRGFNYYRRQYRFTSIILPELDEKQFLGITLRRNNVTGADEPLKRNDGKNKGMAILRAEQIPIIEGLRTGGSLLASPARCRIDTWQIGVANSEMYLALNEFRMLFLAGSPSRFARTTIGANLFLIVYTI